MFPLIGALYYWWPKMTGRMLSEGVGVASFALPFTGFNITFFPMHQLGLQGMPRRVYTYVDSLGWEPLNLVATVGAAILAAGFVITLGNLIWSLRYGTPAGDNPWNAETIEWATSSPPPSYNFLRLPVVRSRWPLWGERSSDDYVSGLRSDRREVLVTRVLDAQPEVLSVLPRPSIWPFLLAVVVCLAFGGFMLHPVFFLVGFVSAFLVIVGWQWPHDEERLPPWKQGQAQ